jgi:putative oxidoreductase
VNDAARLILRLTLGILMLLHGIAKLQHGIDPITGMVVGVGLPAWFAYGVFIGEVIAPLMVIAGWYARIGAWVIAINMVVAVALAHRADLLTMGPMGGWRLELQGFYLATAIAVALLGSGRYAVNDR